MIYFRYFWQNVACFPSDSMTYITSINVPSYAVFPDNLNEIGCDFGHLSCHFTGYMKLTPSLPLNLTFPQD